MDSYIDIISVTLDDAALRSTASEMYLRYITNRKRGQMTSSALLEAERQESSGPSAITYNASLSACERGEAWAAALALLGHMPCKFHELLLGAS